MKSGFASCAAVAASAPLMSALRASLLGARMVMLDSWPMLLLTAVLLLMRAVAGAVRG